MNGSAIIEKKMPAFLMAYREHEKALDELASMVQQVVDELNISQPPQGKCGEDKNVPVLNKLLDRISNLNGLTERIKDLTNLVTLSLAVVREI